MNKLKNNPVDYKIWGREIIEPNTLEQMDIAMRLPVVLGGALMPDAHQGYGLPIGGVMVTDDKIIPYAVGVDIGCMVRLSILDRTGVGIVEAEKALLENTKFGIQSQNESNSTNYKFFTKLQSNKTFAGSLVELAKKQLGSSGGGNHFVEIGEVDYKGEKKIGILSHSGSRGFGAKIAQYYSTLAMEECPLPSVAKHLAWFDIDSKLGKEYWIAMQMAGEYAKINHDDIHQRIIRKLDTNIVEIIENKHNFAWKTNEGIVHRKGATPAENGQLGIIPANMVDKTLIVVGKGNSLSFNSSSHGAGRTMSRKGALESFTQEQLVDKLNKYNVSLLGASLDEAPMAYKNIDTVMSCQNDLVDIVGTFKPTVVRMCKDFFHEVD